jgi:hypothetical protein
VDDGFYLAAGEAADGDDHLRRCDYAAAAAAAGEKGKGFGRTKAKVGERRSQGTRFPFVYCVGTLQTHTQQIPPIDIHAPLGPSGPFPVQKNKFRTTRGLLSKIILGEEDYYFNIPGFF